MSNSSTATDSVQEYLGRLLDEESANPTRRRPPQDTVWVPLSDDGKGLPLIGDEPGHGPLNDWGWWLLARMYRMQALLPVMDQGDPQRLVLKSSHGTTARELATHFRLLRNGDTTLSAPADRPVRVYHAAVHSKLPEVKIAARPLSATALVTDVKTWTQFVDHLRVTARTAT